MRSLLSARRFLASASVLSFGLWLGAAGAPAGAEAKKNTKFPQTLLLIRHAEKTGDKDDVHLSKQGQERADVLDKLFVASKERPDPFPTPDFIFAACEHKDSNRPVETVTPLAKKLKLTINDKFDSKIAKEGKEKPKKEGMVELRTELFGPTKYAGKTVLIAWRHSTLPELATNFKAEKVPDKWADEVFDRVWQIDYDDEGRATFRDRPQRLLPKDSEK
jgi:broad specificity phosphatase PhoE